jgi:hypothetical protein
MLLPLASWLPAALMLQFRLASEEEMHSAGMTEAETSEVRRKIAARGKGRKIPRGRTQSTRVLSRQLPTADRSEFRSLNGTGALLRC